MKKIMSVLLIISVFTSMIIPVKAAEENRYIEFETVFSKEGEDGSYEEMISTGSVLMYYYENKSVRKSVSYSIDSGYLDYVEYTVGSDVFSRAQKVLPKSLSPNELWEYVKTEKNMLTSIVPVNSVIKEFSEEVATTSVSDDERNRILNVLYNNSEPSEFTNGNSRTVVVESKSVLIKESLSYSITEKSKIPVIAGTAISVISTLLAIPESILLTIISFASGADGIYRLVKNFEFKKMDVLGTRVKDCYIDGTKYYQSWLRKQWTAVMGEYGATLNCEYSTCDEYFYNDRKVAEFAYANYKAGYIYPYFELDRLLVK